MAVESVQANKLINFSKKENLGTSRIGTHDEVFWVKLYMSGYYFAVRARWSLVQCATYR